MANRKSPELGPVADSSAADDRVLFTNMLTEHDYARYLKFCFDGRTDSVEQMRNEAARQLKRIGTEPNLRKAVGKKPEGSDQVNPQSLYRWMEKLNKKHRKAVAQLQTLHATASRRLGV